MIFFNFFISVYVTSLLILTIARPESCLLFLLLQLHVSLVPGHVIAALWLQQLSWHSYMCFYITRKV